MTILTVALKNKMIERAVTIAGVDAELSALTKRRSTLAENVRVDSLGGELNVKKIEKEHKKLMKIAGSDVLENVSRYSSNSLIKRGYVDYVNLAGMQVHLYFSGAANDFENRKIGSYIRSPIPSSCTYEAGHEFVEEFLALEKETEVAKGKRSGITAQVRETLNQFTTVKKLLDAWPEAKDLMPKKTDGAKSLLPVVQVQDLNCLIGLPEE